MFTRTQEEKLKALMFAWKAIILIGPRQVWKTTLAKTLFESYPNASILSLSGDYSEDVELLGSRNSAKLFSAVSGHDVIFIDEGQKVERIGEAVKILVDRFGKEKQVLVTGSSSFHLLNQSTESLAGRKRVVPLFPVSFWEIANDRGFARTDADLESLIVYGQYPAVLNASSDSERRAELLELTSSALYRDILELQSVKNSSSLVRLLKILALSVWSELSLNSIGQELGLEVRTVERYIDLLEKSYVVFRLPPFFSNKRKEIVKMQKAYFYDTGIRNAVLRNFLPLDSRNDSGALWENWMISERMKALSYAEWTGTSHFWRSNAQQEIDLVESDSGNLATFEIKWRERSSKLPSGFKNLYGEVPFSEIHRQNYWEFLKIARKGA